MEKQNIIVVSRKGSTLIFCDGEVYGDNITKFSFVQNGAHVDLKYEANRLPLKGISEFSSLKESFEGILKKYEPASSQNDDLRLTPERLIEKENCSDYERIRNASYQELSQMSPTKIEIDLPKTTGGEQVE